MIVLHTTGATITLERDDLDAVASLIAEAKLDNRAWVRFDLARGKVEVDPHSVVAIESQEG